MALTNRQIALVLLLDKLGLEGPRTYEERRMVQAAVYIAKVAGVDCGYRYGWYVYGPYSPSLGDDLDKLYGTWRRRKRTEGL